jgi:hypothetical protein
MGKVTCSLQAVHTHKTDDDHLKDEQIREESISTFILFLILTGQAEVRRGGQVEKTEVEVLQD